LSNCLHFHFFFYHLLSFRDARAIRALPSIPNNHVEDTYLDEQLSYEGAKKATRSFISGFTRGGIAIYKEHLLRNAREGLYFLEIDLEDLKNDKEALHDSVLKDPNEYIPLVSYSNKIYTIFTKS
jgi:hypothetical protein